MQRKKAGSAARPTAPDRSRRGTAASGINRSSARRASGRVASEKRKAAQRGRPRTQLRRSQSRSMRTGEAASIIRASLLPALVLVLALGVLAMLMPQLRLSRARTLVRSGSLDAAENLINVLESEGTPEARIDSVRLELAEQHVRAGDYDYALTLAADLPASDRLTEVTLASRYGLAQDRFDAHDYEGAAQRFYQLADYRDSAQRYVDCRCAMAVAVYLTGDEEAARSALLAVEGAPERIAEVVRQVAESDAQAEQLLSQRMFNGEGLVQLKQELAELSAARASVVAGRVAAGYRHTVGLKSDGTVLAAGNNTFGQCEVESWQDIIQVAAGAKHTLGLRTDGTVAATGDNTYGQCDVSGWTGITAIAASAYGSFGLRQDGTVVSSSRYAELVSGWHGVTMIAAGSYSAGCLYGADGMLCTHRGGQLSASAGLVCLTVCGPMSAGINAEGRLISSYSDAPEWTGMRYVAAGENGLVGVTDDGRALSYSFREKRTTELAVEGTALEAAISGTHIVVMNADGRVFAFGLDDEGQCDVSDWRL